MYDGQRVESEEVHLEHADVLDVMSVILRCPEFLFLSVLVNYFLVLRKADGDIVHQVSASDDSRAGVDSHLTDAAFELKSVVQHLLSQFCAVFQFFLKFRNKPVAVLEGNFRIRLFLADLIVLLDEHLLPRIVRIIDLHLLHDLAESLFQFVELWVEWIFLLYHFAQTVGNHLCEPVGIIDAHAADSRHVLDCRLCRHRSEGDDTRDVVKTVMVLYIFMRGSEVFEVHVNIRHADTVRIEETLEQELVLDRVEVRNPEAGGDHRTGSRATSGAHHRTHRAGGSNIVLNDEEVVRETHSADCLELEIDSLALLLREGLPVADVCALVGQMAEIRHRAAELLPPVCAVLVAAPYVNHVLILLQLIVYVRKKVLRQIELRQHVTPVNLVALNLIRDLKRVGQHLRMLREQSRHLLLALEELLLSVAHPVNVVEISSCVEAEKPVVRRPVLLLHEVHVVSGHDLDSHLLCEPEYPRIGNLLLFPDLLRHSRNFCPVGLHLKVVIFTEQVLVPPDCLACLFLVPVYEISRHLPGDAGGQTDEILVPFFQNLVAHPRLVVVLALNVPRGDNLHQVLVTLVVLGKKNEVVVALVVVVLEMVVIVARDIDLASENRLYIRVLCGIFQELLDSVHVAVVRDGKRRHPQFLSPVK